MPNIKHANRHHNRRKLQDPKENLVTAQFALQPLRRLRQAKARPQINQQRRPHQRHRERPHPAHHHLPRAPQENPQQHEKHPKGEYLERQTAQKDIIRRGRILPVTLGRADQRGAGNLHDRRDDIASNETPENQLGIGGRELPADGGDEDAEDGVDGGGEKDGRDDDEEVLHDEVDDVVGRASGGQDARDVADCLEGGADGQRAEVPGFVARYLVGVQQGGNAEEDYAEQGEGEGGGVAVGLTMLVYVISRSRVEFRSGRGAGWSGGWAEGVERGEGGGINVPIDDDGRVVWASRVGKVRIDVVFASVRHGLNWLRVATFWMGFLHCRKSLPWVMFASRTFSWNRRIS